VLDSKCMDYGAVGLWAGLPRLLTGDGILVSVGERRATETSAACLTFIG